MPPGRPEDPGIATPEIYSRGPPDSWMRHTGGFGSFLDLQAEKHTRHYQENMSPGWHPSLPVSVTVHAYLIND